MMTHRRESAAGYEVRVLKRLTVLAALLTLGLTLGGCSKCGFWWDDGKSSPRSCKSDVPK
jgi:hypothetical protein